MKTETEMETPQSFDPNTGIKEEASKSKPKNIFIIMGIVLTVAVVTGGIFWFVLSHFAGNQKVLLAFERTYSTFVGNSQLLKDIDITELKQKGEYSADIDFDTELGNIGDISVNMIAGVSKEAVGVGGKVILSYIPPVEFNLYMDDTSLHGSTSMLPDYLFCYQYDSPSDGFISQYFDTNRINADLSRIYKAMTKAVSAGEDSKELVDSLKENLKEIKFVATSKKELELENGRIRCQGYEAQISKEALEDIGDKLKAYSYKHGMEFICDTLDAAWPVEALDCYVYVYKDKLAQVVLSRDEEELARIDISGVDSTSKAIAVFENDRLLLEIHQRRDTLQEELIIRNANGTGLGYIYDTSEGKLRVDLNLGEEVSSFNITVRRLKDELTLDVDYFDYGDSYLGGRIRIYPGADVKELSGESFDIGKANEEDYQTLRDYIYKLIMELMGW